MIRSNSSRLPASALDQPVAQETGGLSLITQPHVAHDLGRALPSIPDSRLLPPHLPCDTRQRSSTQTVYLRDWTTGSDLVLCLSHSVIVSSRPSGHALERSGPMLLANHKQYASPCAFCLPCPQMHLPAAFHFPSCSSPLANGKCQRRLMPHARTFAQDGSSPSAPPTSTFPLLSISQASVFARALASPSALPKIIPLHHCTLHASSSEAFVPSFPQ